MAPDVALVWSWLAVLAYLVAQPLVLMRTAGAARAAAALPLAVTAPVLALAAVAPLPPRLPPLVCTAALLYLLAVGAAPPTRRSGRRNERC
jgi:hypothetical protein